MRNMGKEIKKVFGLSFLFGVFFLTMTFGSDSNCPVMDENLYNAYAKLKSKNTIEYNGKTYKVMTNKSFKFIFDENKIVLQEMGVFCRYSLKGKTQGAAPLLFLVIKKEPISSPMGENQNHLPLSSSPSTHSLNEVPGPLVGGAGVPSRPNLPSPTRVMTPSRPLSSPLAQTSTRESFVSPSSPANSPSLGNSKKGYKHHLKKEVKQAAVSGGRVAQRGAKGAVIVATTAPRVAGKTASGAVKGARKGYDYSKTNSSSFKAKAIVRGSVIGAAKGGKKEVKKIQNDVRSGY